MYSADGREAAKKGYSTQPGYSWNDFLMLPQFGVCKQSLAKSVKPTKCALVITSAISCLAVVKQQNIYTPQPIITDTSQKYCPFKGLLTSLIYSDTFWYSLCHVEVSTHKYNIAVKHLERHIQSSSFTCSSQRLHTRDLKKVTLAEPFQQLHCYGCVMVSIRFPLKCERSDFTSDCSQSSWVCCHLSRLSSAVSLPCSRANKSTAKRASGRGLRKMIKIFKATTTIKIPDSQMAQVKQIQVKSNCGHSAGTFSLWLATVFLTFGHASQVGRLFLRINLTYLDQLWFTFASLISSVSPSIVCPDHQKRCTFRQFQGSLVLLKHPICHDLSQHDHHSKLRQVWRV